MATQKKPTKKEIYTNLLADLHAQNITEYDEFLAHELELLDRKRTSAKPTKEQEHTERLMLVIRDILDHPMRVSEIAENEEVQACVDKDGNAPSANKVSATLRKMKDNGEVTRTEEKKVAYFSLAE